MMRISPCSEISMAEVVFYHVLIMSEFYPIRHLQGTLLKNQHHSTLNKLLLRYAFHDMKSWPHGLKFMYVLPISQLPDEFRFEN